MTEDKHIAMWAWPWDIWDEGIDETVKFAKSTLGLTALNVATVYHSGKFLLPHNPRRKVYFPESGVTYFRPNLGLYKGLRLQPLVSSLVQEEDFYPHIREACQREGLNFVPWVVALHNSGQGRRHPDCCQRNAYGDVYPYALCPSNSDSREYIKTVVSDIATQFAPYAVDVESPNYIGYVHHFHHERTPMNYGDLEVFLLSLCFCDTCRRAAQEAGIDIDRLQQWVRETIDRRINEDWFSGEWRKKNMAELYGLLMVMPELVAFIRVRQAIVTSLVRELKETCKAAGTKLFTIASIFSHPSSQAWTEGADLPELAEVADGLGICAFYPTAAEVLDDLRFAVSVVPDRSKLIAGIKSYMPAATSKDVLLREVSAAKSLGLSKFSFSNYGCTNGTRLKWLAEAVKLIRS